MNVRREPDDFLRHTVPTIILAVLLRNPRMHGYAITRKIESLSGEKLKLGQATLYPALNLLLEEGYVEAEVVIPPKGPTRKVYQLTDKGKIELERQKVSFESNLISYRKMVYGGTESIEAT